MINKIRKSLFLLFFLLVVLSMFADFAFASSTDGTIDPNNEGYKYAWGENIGWVNFRATNSIVHITDSGLSGYALGENIGWINLDNVTNDGEGNLSGYAWGENAGWIKFNPTNGGVIINSSGEFTGLALGENIGWIIFDCSTSACVKTDWRPQSVRVCTSWTYSDWSSCSNSQQTRTIVSSSPSGCSGGSPVLSQSCSSGGGGGLPAGAYNPPAPPTEGFSILINQGGEYTENREVTLKLIAGSDTARMAISNNPDFKEAGQESYQTTKTWTLTEGEGVKTVYVKFYTQYGQASEVVSDTIVFRKEKPIIEKLKEIPGKVIEEIKKIPEIFKPKPPEEVKPLEVPIEELVPEEAPSAMQGKWKLLITYTILNKPMVAFTQAPLPKEITKLTEKFPELGETLKKVGITKITDIEKLKTVKLTLPGLTENLRPYGPIGLEGVGLPAGVPIAKLSAAAKQQIPTEIVFAKTGGELIDFNIALSVTEKGEPEQRINTISGKPLQLVVKPDKPVKSVKGYVVFKSKKKELGSSNQELSLNSLLASMVFALPSFAKEYDPVEIEERLVLLEFEYTDLDGDGIYTAEIQAPVVEGEYEIITVMDFEDPALGTKEIRLITVVDPEGYVYEKDGDKETRIPGAIISLFWLNPETKQYELWPAKEYQQENPQTTDVRGTYSFLVPEGYYYLKVEAPGYLVYDGKPFQVKEGSGVHFNIELKTKFWWLKIVDLKTLILTIVILLLAILLFYNFYRDKMRTKR